LRSIVAPSHALIQAFLLQKKDFKSIKNVVVESHTDATKLKNNLDALISLKIGEQKEYQIISSHNDVLKTIHYPETIGIYTTEKALNPPENTDTKNLHILVLKKDAEYTEKQLIEWVTNNGYETKKMTDEIGTYFRQGDTINMFTHRGILQVSFFSGKIEDIYLEREPQETYTLISRL
jgi:transcription-repair coupling factor (superfamily II helicase)